MRDGQESDAEAFKASLDRRLKASQALQKDLLNEVPMLYGSPGAGMPGGDPGIALAEIHRENLRRRNGIERPNGPENEESVMLPYERFVAAIAIILGIFSF